MKFSQIFSRISFHKSISTILIFVLLISQTIRVDFFDTAEAGPENYRDIVSIIVDRDTYSEESSRIKRYANDIASYLGGVRTSILVVEKDTPVSAIAAKNEKLYYEGDGEQGTSGLVGTILLGNIPLPIVQKEGQTFSSLYPYVDFVDKVFVHSPQTDMYVYHGAGQSESADIWHGVINPAVGRTWEGDTDIEKIGKFLDKTHDFYTHSGKFALTNVTPPKVLYYDGHAEFQSMDVRSAYQYSLTMNNSENIVYNRYTKYLLSDVSHVLAAFDMQNADPDVVSTYASMGIPQGSDTLSDDQIKKIPDIQTKEVTKSFLKNFSQLFNEKTLGEELAAVHNAGRYNSGAYVGADILPITISLMDEVARATLRSSNEALMLQINNQVASGGVASPIVIYDKRIVKAAPATITTPKEYRNYFFGKPASEVTDPSQCTIARGYSGDVNQFGRSVLVEANTAFDIGSTLGQMDILKNDTETMVNLHRNATYSCFDPKTNKVKLQSYWGGNSILRISTMVDSSSTSTASNGMSDDFLFGPLPNTSLTGFLLPIFALGGMKETNRLPNTSIKSCIDTQYQYSLVQPYIETFYDAGSEHASAISYDIAYPNEWNSGWRYTQSGMPRFTCNSVLYPDAHISFEKSIEEYTSRTCFAGSLYLDGKEVKKATKTCITTSGANEDAVTVDNTTYEDRYYHTIPSVLTHISPTDAEIAAAQSGGVTPSLPVDQIRFIEFQTPRGNVARINYPNFFALQGNTIAEARKWIKEQSISQWKPIFISEQTPITTGIGFQMFRSQYASGGTLFLSGTTLTHTGFLVNPSGNIIPSISNGSINWDNPGVPIDWNTYISDDMITKILQARVWLSPDISSKYRHALESSLSYTHAIAGATGTLDVPPVLPVASQDYEIAYLGLPTSFSPDFGGSANSASTNNYYAKLQEIQAANITEESVDDPSNPQTQCGPPDGVPLLQWPGAILCWVNAQFPPRITAGSCGAKTLGLDTDTTGKEPNMTNISTLSGVRISPVSSALVQGNTTLAMIRLVDRLGNDIDPDIHRLRIDISGGYIVDEIGEKKNSLTMDTMESQVPILVGSDSPGTLIIHVTADDTIKNDKEIPIYKSAIVILSRTNDPHVGGMAIGAHIEIQDETGKRLTGISSVAGWSLPDGAGVFSSGSIEITDGISPEFQYIPGTVSGDHTLELDIPGVGHISDISFSLLPGDPLYIAHTRSESAISFVLKDRYANTVSNISLTGTLVYNTNASVPIVFSNGVYQIPLQGGYYNVRAPGLLSFGLTYIDQSGTHTIPGIDTYSAYIEGSRDHVDFPSDYNARYTILAGGKYLRESEDILYNTTVGASQSLAVSTLLENPYTQKVPLVLFPGGAYQTINQDDAPIDMSISLSDGLPLVSVTDSVTHKQIARILYPMKNAQFEICQQKQTNSCQDQMKKAGIRLIVPENSILTGSLDTALNLDGNNNAHLLSFARDGSIQKSSMINLVPKAQTSLGLEMSVLYNGQEVATVIYMMDRRLSVFDGSPTGVYNTPVILSSPMVRQPVSLSPFGNNIVGYRFIDSSSSTEINEVQNAPSFIDSIGAIRDVSGVGWQGNNTMMLAYTAGDTVGESTRLFQTYTFVNFGDPVAHVDQGRKGTQVDGIDRTVGSLIARGDQFRIADFMHRDMNADGLDDLVVIYENGYMELFLNLGNKFRSRGMILYNRDIDTGKVHLADFTHDGYADVVGVNSQGKLILIDNTNRRWNRKDITIEGSGAIPEAISQLKIYDMDSDGKDDIVYLTSGGELGILYGTSTAGTFTKKILDPTLGITLSTDPIRTGGAIRTSKTPHIEGTTRYEMLSENNTKNIINTGSLTNTGITNTGADDSMLKSEVFYQLSSPVNTAAIQENVSPDEIANALNGVADGTKSGNKVITYVRSQYAPAYGLQIEKTYVNTTHTMLYPDDVIRATIRITNTTTQKMEDVEYLDTFVKAFATDNTTKYTIKDGDASVTRDFETLSADTMYDAHFTVGSIGAGKTIEIQYETRALPASYGEMVVGDFEKGTPGADIYGDVGFKTSTTCGASMLLWSSGPAAREYTRGTHEFGTATLPDALATRLSDGDKDGVPDSITNMSLEDRKSLYNEVNNSTNIVSSSTFMDVTRGGGSIEFNIGFNEDAANKLITMGQNLMDGLSCGFGGGGCLNSPINWAPLAPGSSPSLFGFPLSPNLMTPSAGVPLFSGLTGIPIYGFHGCFPIPTIFPASVIGLTTTCTANVPGAGGSLGAFDPANQIRVYVTPTLTLGVGTAICMGGPSIAAGLAIPPGLSPLVPGGNCIVIAKSMNVCKNDGSDIDVTAISGLGTTTDAWNSSTCSPQAKLTETHEDTTLTQNIITYLKNPKTSELNGLYSRMAERGSLPISSSPMLTIGGNLSGGTEIEFSFDSNTKLSDIGSVIKVKNTQIAAFPDFIMDWLDRQINEIKTAFLTPPNITIITPTSLGQNTQLNGDAEGLVDKLKNQFNTANFETLKTSMSEAYKKQVQSQSQSNVPDILKSSNGKVQGGLSAMRTAYAYIAKTPFITLKTERIPINIPVIDKRELDKYTRSIKGYLDEINRAATDLCIKDPSKECLDQKAKLESSALVSSLRENLKRIDEYKNFPKKLQKYITWKEKYLTEILCNINIIQKITGGWLHDNAVRLRHWVELYVLVKAIIQGWQPIIDIFTDANKDCAPCRNERNSLQYWEFKLISMIIPTIPVIKFPRWPDIVLDLSDIRLGISVSLPDFDPRLSPVRLPSLPNLSIGSVSVMLRLPPIPLLPPIPPLPDLPDLQSLPNIKLPDLPPPPKLPKIAGAIQGFFSIMKLISKMYCFFQKSILVPEWRAGDVIAQRTDRQGTLPLDFLNINLPQISLPSIKEIRVSSHVNFELRSDIISEMAHSIVKPINSIQTDLQRATPSKIGNDVVVPGVNIDINKKLQSFLNTEKHNLKSQNVIDSFIAQIEKDKDVFLDVDEFSQVLLREFHRPGFARQYADLVTDLASARVETENLEKKFQVSNNKRFELLTKIIEAEHTKNAKLQNIIDTLSDAVSPPIYELIADERRSHDRSEKLIEQYTRLSQDSIRDRNATISIDSHESGIQQAGKQISQKLKRIAATTGTITPPSSVGTSTTAGYSPNLQGVYIRTPSGVQTRLFDYISSLTEETRVDTLDIDRDGDLDYIYVLDGALYVKYNHTKEPHRIVDTFVKVSTIDPNDLVQYIPDYFHEDVSTPSNLNYSFEPADPLETEWRVQFYDQYVEWDAVDIGADDPKKIPKTTIDMFLTLPVSRDAAGSGILNHRVPRSLSSVADPASFIIEGRNIDVYTGALSINLSPGRVLYTGKDPVDIKYKKQGSTEELSLRMKPYMGYEFQSSTEISMQRGLLYLIGSENGNRYIYSDTLIGLPILPGMRMYASDRGATIHNHTDNSDLMLSYGATYITRDLGPQASLHQVSIPYPDGYYFARLQNLTQKKTDRAGVVLFAPQAASDRGEPVIDLPSRIRLPIYDKKVFTIADILTELTHTTLTIDSDLTIDTDKNGIYTDDFSSSGTIFRITNSDITFGPFPTPGSYPMMLRAVDEQGNTAIFPLSVEAYTPIPQIQSVTNTGTVIGALSEKVPLTPIHFFRVRSGESPHIVSTGSVFTDAIGSYASGSFFRDPETIALGSHSFSGKINSHGVFTLPSGYHIDISPATQSGSMQFLIVDQTGSISHIHTLATPPTTDFIDLSQRGSPSSTSGILIDPLTSTLVRASLTDPSIPRGMYIVDSMYRPLVAIAQDGNIYRLDPTTTLQYREKNGYLLIQIVKGTTIQATVEYHLEFFYTMK